MSKKLTLLFDRMRWDEKSIVEKAKKKNISFEFFIMFRIITFTHSEALLEIERRFVHEIIPGNIKVESMNIPINVF